MASETGNIKLTRSNALDGFRGLGCLLVMFGHTQWNGISILPGAVVAMDFFFVLSGFLITGLILMEHKKTNSVDLMNFWKRRATRLLPAFYVYFSFGALIYLFSRFQPIIGTSSLVTLLSTAFYGSNWAVAKGYELGIFAVTWSLSLEEQFYFLCPILFLLCLKYLNRKTMMMLLGVAIVGVNIHRYNIFNQMIADKGIVLAWKRAFFALDTRSDSLLIGCFSAVIYNLYNRKFSIGPGVAGCAFAVFCIAIGMRDVPVLLHIAQNSFYTNFLMTGGFTLYSIMAAIIFIHLVQFPESTLSKFFSSKFLVKIGLMSYSIYLWHTTIFGGLDILLKSFNQTPVLWLLKTLIRFVVAIGVGYTSYKYIELPVLNYLNKKRKYIPIPSAEVKG